MRVLLRMIAKEFLQLRRDRRMMVSMIMGPMVQLLALGYAANTDVTLVPMLLVDQDRTPASRDLVNRFTGSGYFRITGSEETVEGVEPWLIRGDAQIALVIGRGFGSAIGRGERPAVQVLADGSDSSSAIVGLGYASRIVSAAGLDAVTAGGDGARAPDGVTRTGRIELVPRVWYNPDLKSRWFYVPAILAMTLMLTTMILPSMAVVREREVGTMEQLIVTPIRPWQLIVGKLFPFVVVGFVDLLLVTALAVGLFGVPLRGSLLQLILLTMLFLTTTLGLGLLVSSIVRSQQQAMIASVFLMMVPMIYLSGLIFPIENMPRPIQYVTLIIPLRYYANVIRGVFLKGSGLSALWPDALFLGSFGLATLTIASLRFRKKLD